MGTSTTQQLAGAEDVPYVREFVPYGPHREPDTLKKVALSPLSVLISGETGTGKEVLAQEIHALSGRTGPFFAINCGAIAESLIESELFGHKKGSFTGAFRDHRGYLEEAQKGTLFLDEITEMPLPMQSRLLRVLQERTVVPVGATRPVPLDVRIVSATNRDPAEAVRDGKLRQDLYYRLNMFTLPLPALRDQPRDVVPLAEFFLRQAAHEERVAARFAEDAKALLTERREWPGNIRQLKSLVQTAFYLHAGPPEDREITARELGALPAPRAETPPLSSSAESDAKIIAALSVKSIADIRRLSAEGQRAAITHAIRETGGNVAEAAERLGIKRINLYKMMKTTGSVTPREIRREIALQSSASLSAVPRPGKG